MYHIATHNKGLGSYNDDFNRLVKDLFNEGPLKLHFMIATYTQVLTNNANRQQKKIKNLVILGPVILARFFLVVVRSAHTLKDI